MSSNNQSQATNQNGELGKDGQSTNQNGELDRQFIIITEFWSTKESVFYYWHKNTNQI